MRLGLCPGDIRTGLKQQQLWGLQTWLTAHGGIAADPFHELHQFEQSHFLEFLDKF